MMDGKKLRGELVKRVARIGAHTQAVRAGRDQLVKRAQEQLDTIGPTITTVEQAVEAGKGGILMQRRLRTLLSERERLQRIVADHQERRDRRNEAAS